jgi:hypothetical protein
VVLCGIRSRRLANLDLNILRLGVDLLILPLDGTILPSVTRASIMKIARVGFPLLLFIFSLQIKPTS